MWWLRIPGRPRSRSGETLLRQAQTLAQSRPPAVSARYLSSKARAGGSEPMRASGAQEPSSYAGQEREREQLSLPASLFQQPLSPLLHLNREFRGHRSCEKIESPEWRHTTHNWSWMSRSLGVQQQELWVELELPVHRGRSRRQYRTVGALNVPIWCV